MINLKSEETVRTVVSVILILIVAISSGLTTAAYSLIGGIMIGLVGGVLFIFFQKFFKKTKHR